jgi:hypothetical protein
MNQYNHPYFPPVKDSAIKTLEGLRQQLQTLEGGLDDPMVINWLTFASLALSNAQAQLRQDSETQWKN